jgi:hypothetical protein
MSSKNILLEVVRIKNLMGINESEIDVLDSNEFTDVENCDYYTKMDPPSGVSYWFQQKYQKMLPDEKNQIQNVINTYVKEELKKVIDSYVSYYGSGDGNFKLVTKFIKSENKESEVQKLLDYLKETTYQIIWSKEETPTQFLNVISSWAFTQGNLIYVNLFNFWDSTAAGKKSMYDTLKHEVGHVLHNYMLNNPTVFKSPFYTTNYSQEKITNKRLGIELGDKEIHAYLQSFRDLFNIKPFDKGTEIVNIIKEKVNNGNLYWDNGELKVVGNYLCFIQKNGNGSYTNITANNADEFINISIYNLKIKTDTKTTDEHWADTTYLLSNFIKFGIGSQVFPDDGLPSVKIGYVNLNDIGTINYDFAQNYVKNSEENFG